MKTMFLFLALFSASPALADTFNLTLEGKTFTCIEGGSAACICRKDASGGQGFISAYVGDIRVGEWWHANQEGITQCKNWIKKNPETCQ